MGTCKQQRQPNRRKTHAKRPTREQLQAAYGKHVVDVVGPEMHILFVGINPGLYSAAVGHHYARPGNRFWPALHGAGFSDRLLSPSEEHLLLDKGYGIVNLVDRATVRADELTKQELQHGIQRLKEKVRQLTPACVAFVGISVFRTAFDDPAATIGPQDVDFSGARVWVLPDPSGLNAHYQLPDLIRILRNMRLDLGDTTEVQ